MPLIVKGTVLRVDGYDLIVSAILNDGVLLNEGTVISFAEAEKLV